MNDHKLEGKILIALFLVFYTVVVLRNAWVCDDAYISFRTVDNFIHGYGLTWNVDERVQAFTHPLWVFVMALPYLVSGNIYFTALAVSIALSLAAVAWYGFKIADSAFVAALGIAILSLSDAFIDFSTSGLENPLTYFILVLFLFIYIKRESSIKSLFLLSLLAGLAAVNRADTFLLYLPVLLYTFWTLRSRKALRALVLGLSPFIIWELFSLLYYGFPFPNTAYAKLHTGVPDSILIQQGFVYFINSFNVDPLTVMVIAGGLVIPFISRDKKMIPVVVGLALILLYVIRIGGCFMSGRYLAAPLLCAVIILSRSMAKVSSGIVALAGGIVLLLGLTSSFDPIYTRYDQGQNHEPVRLPNGICDERKFYFLNTGLANFSRAAYTWPVMSWVDEGRTLRDQEVKVHTAGCIGMLGFYAGPKVHIIDVNALADPLLARLPIYNAANPGIGHFTRAVPSGYANSIAAGKNRIEDPNLAAYYDKLCLLTRGRLFGLRRLGEIVKFNFGAYDDLVQKYVENDVQKAALAEINQPKPQGTPWDAAGNIIIIRRALEIDLGKTYFSPKVDLGRDANDDYRLVFMRNGRKVADRLIRASMTYIEGLAIASIDVPREAIEQGYDKIMVLPEKGDGMYSIGYIRMLEPTD